MSKALILIACSLALAGCDLEKIRDPHSPSPAQQAMVERQKLLTPAPVAQIAQTTAVEVPVALVEVSETEVMTEIAVVEEIAPLITPQPEPECHDNLFRIYHCVDNKRYDWGTL